MPNFFLNKNDAFLPLLYIQQAQSNKRAIRREKKPNSIEKIKIEKRQPK